MTIQKQVYRCNVCGNIVEVLHAGKGELVCCGQPIVAPGENGGCWSGKACARC